MFMYQQEHSWGFLDFTVGYVTLFCSTHSDLGENKRSEIVLRLTL